MTRSTRDEARTAIVCAAVVGAFLSAVGFTLFGGRTGWSVAVGAALGVANLVAMRLIVRSLLADADSETDAEPEPGDASTPQASRTPLSGEARPEGNDDASEAPATERKRYAGAWGAFALFKMLLLFGGIWLILSRRVVDPIPLVIGYGVLPLGIVLSTLLSSLSVGKRSRRGPPKR